MKRLFANFTWMRFLRIGLGILVLIQAIVLKDAVYGMLAAFLLFTGIANVPCCGGGSCAVDPKKPSSANFDANERLDSK